jgi:uncharacterized protein
MSGETDLRKLLGSMNPALSEDSFVFVCSDKPISELASLQPWALIAEGEGTTVIIERAAADSRGLRYQAVYRRITLMVHSSLEAVGLTAAVSTRLASHGISANIVAAFYHDHIFVQEDKAIHARSILARLASENSSGF